MTAPLRDLFDKASVPPAPQSLHARLDSVHRRISRIRRQRVVAASATVAAVTLAVTGSLVALRGPTAAPPPVVPNATHSSTPSLSPSPTAETIAGFPEYAEGTRIVAAVSATAPTTTAKLRFTRTTQRLFLLVRCADPTMRPVVTLPTGSEEGLDCGTARQELDPPYMPLGEPVTLTLRVSVDGMPAGSAFGLAVGVPVAFEDYPLPPQPSVLPALPARPSRGEVLATIRNVPGDPLAPRTVKVPVRDYFEIFARLSTPGSLQVSYRGQPFMTCVKWDYAPMPAALTPLDYARDCVDGPVTGDPDNAPRPGSLVEFKVIPEHVTGDWVVYIEAG